MKKYKFRYKTPTFDGAWETTCSSVLTAIHQFHKHMQIELAKKPDEYTLVFCGLAYSDGASGTGGNQIESGYDLPKTANPDLRPLPQHTNEQQELIAGIQP